MHPLNTVRPPRAGHAACCPEPDALAGRLCVSALLYRRIMMYESMMSYNNIHYYYHISYIVLSSDAAPCGALVVIQLLEAAVILRHTFTYLNYTIYTTHYTHEYKLYHTE